MKQQDAQKQSTEQLMQISVNNAKERHDKWYWVKSEGVVIDILYKNNTKVKAIQPQFSKRVPNTQYRKLPRLRAMQRFKYNHCMLNSNIVKMSSTSLDP